MPTFDALVQACSQLLPELGYEKLTTNVIAERAGTSIGTLYEYFPSKDAIIAMVVERLVERVMARLGRDLQDILASDESDPMQRWIGRIYDIIDDERALIAVLVQQVPYTRQLEVMKNLPQTLLEFSERGRVAAGIEMAKPAEALLLVNNLVSTTMLQILLEPPSNVSKDDVIRMLGTHVSAFFEKR